MQQNVYLATVSGSSDGLYLGRDGATSEGEGWKHSTVGGVWRAASVSLSPQRKFRLINCAMLEINLYYTEQPSRVVL